MSALWIILNSSWSHPEVILKSSWSHPEAILKSSWSHPEVILKSSWGHPEVILRSFWSCPEVFLKSSWNHPEVVLKLSWSCPNAQSHPEVVLKCPELLSEPKCLMMISFTHPAKRIYHRTPWILILSIFLRMYIHFWMNIVGLCLCKYVNVDLCLYQ